MVFASFVNVDKIIQVIFCLLYLNILSKFIMLFRYQSLATFPPSHVFRCFSLFPFVHCFFMISKSQFNSFQFRLFFLYKKLNSNKQDNLSSEVDKLVELTAATEESLANLPSDSLDDMLSSLQVCTSSLQVHQAESSRIDLKVKFYLKIPS